MPPSHADEGPRGTDQFIEVVKQHEAQASAQHDSKDGRSGDEVGQLVLGDFRQAPTGEVAHHHVGRVESEHVTQAIPMHANLIGEANQVR